MVRVDEIRRDLLVLIPSFLRICITTIFIAGGAQMVP
jgi:hypothetical protein